ncbi:MAG: hypothetical protein Q7J60_10085 [Bradyrhizobium sp.]|nr:hypothetical protein [Bradyrhizobium sp.]
MKRVAIWAFYAVGALAIGYLALYAYAVFTGRDLQPGDPIHIFRRPDAPEYSRAPLNIGAIPGRCEASNPESRDSGSAFRASRNGGVGICYAVAAMRP